MHERPQVHVCDAGVRSPVHDVSRVNHRFWINCRAGAEGHVAAGRAGRGANGAVKEGRAKPMEKAAVEAAALKLAHRHGVYVIHG